MGFEAMTSAMVVLCSNNWAMKPHSWEKNNLLGSFVPVKDLMNEMNRNDCLFDDRVVDDFALCWTI